MFHFKAKVPSNIAIIKYWGKFARQFPCNPSLSFTLSHCYTEIDFSFEAAREFKLLFTFESQVDERFAQRVRENLELYIDEFQAPCGVYTINTSNTFPHSSGIASSASAFASVALAIEALISHLDEQKSNLERASAMARLASGSACRSVYGGFVSWGQDDVLEGSNEFAIPLDDVHQSFKNIHDSVLIVDSGTKAVSSSHGHQLMNGHYFKDIRFEQARENHRLLINALKQGDWQLFIEICETEALTLHSLMMTSSPSFILLQPNSLAIISLIRKFREDSGLHLCFTIDAGPNIHLLYDEKHKNKVETFIKTELKSFYQKAIFDRLGDGPVFL